MRRFAPGLRAFGLQLLEDRRMLAPVDLNPTAFNVSGTQLSVSFGVTEATAPAFDIGIYSTTDGSTPGTLLMTSRVSNSADRTVGSHTVGFQASFTDLSTDYQLLAKLDASAEVSEEYETNNVKSFAGGVFQAADGAVHVQGTNSADAVTITQGSQVNVTLNGSTKSFTPSGVSAIRVRVLGGNDSVVADSTVTKQITGFGGSGNDVIIGGSAADALFGGAGDDWLYGLEGDDNLYGDFGVDILDAGVGANVVWTGSSGGSSYSSTQYAGGQGSPEITDFSGTQNVGGTWVFTGKVSDNGEISGSVSFGGALDGLTAPVGPDGSFELGTQLAAGTSGLITVTYRDPQGNTTTDTYYFG